MALIVDGLSIRAAAVTLLDRVSAQFQPGRITAILGPNGAGKSTLVKAIASLVSPAGGNVAVDGRDVAGMTPRERAQVIGYLPQEPQFHWNVTVGEAVALGRLPWRSPFAGPSEVDRAAIDVALEATATSEFRSRPLATLSGGEQARVLLGRVLAGMPRWLIADEPLASLDPAHQIDLLERLRTYAANGHGVVLVLHDLLQAGRVADDVLLLKRGRALAFGPASQVLTSANLATAFDIRVDVARGPDGELICLPLGR